MIFLHCYIGARSYHQSAASNVMDEHKKQVIVYKAIGDRYPQNQLGIPGFENNPVSRFRPQGTFKHHRDLSIQLPPVLTVLTVTKNPRISLMETAASILGQTLGRLRWVIVNDHSDSLASTALMSQVARLDSRVTVLNNTYDPGYKNACNFAFDHAISNTTYYALLDDDDIMELTAYEKAVVLLELQPEFHMVGFYSMNYGAKNFTWTRGWHDRDRNLYENGLMVASVVRTSVLETKCRFRIDGGGDWDYWLCLAENGKWGLTIPEFNFWYRVNDEAFRKSRWSNLFAEEGQVTVPELMQQYHPALFSGQVNISNPKIPTSTEGETISSQALFSNKITGKSIMFIVPWLVVGGSEDALFHIINYFVKSGWRVTIVCTLFSEEHATQPLFMQLTHDIIHLPHIAALRDWPKVLAYLIESRDPSAIFISNSQAGYALLPFLRKLAPNTPLLDYVHAVDESWKGGGYAKMSCDNYEWLNKSFVSSQNLKDWMIQQGRPQLTIDVARLGIILPSVSLSTSRTKSKQIVIAIVGRLHPGKRPLMAIDILSDILQRHKNLDVVLKFLGDGEEREAVEEKIAKKGLEKHVQLLGSVNDEKVHVELEGADIFFLPSSGEGISLAAAEAMAHGLPVVSTLVGGMGEIILPSCGYLIPLQNTTYQDQAEKYREALYQLIQDEEKRHDMGKSCQQIVQTLFNREVLIPSLGDTIVSMIHTNNTNGQIHHTTLSEDTLISAEAGLNEIREELRSYCDFEAVQRRLQVPQRSGFGATLQRHCGEASDDMTRWIEGLVSVKNCTASNVQPDMLREFAVKQCGQWCIFNVSDPGFVGWIFDGECWDLFESHTHSCVTNFSHLKPKIIG